MHLILTDDSSPLNNSYNDPLHITDNFLSIGYKSVVSVSKDSGGSKGKELINTSDHEMMDEDYKYHFGNAKLNTLVAF